MAGLDAFDLSCFIPYKNKNRPIEVTIPPIIPVAIAASMAMSSNGLHPVESHNSCGISLAKDDEAIVLNPLTDRKIPPMTIFTIPKSTLRFKPR